MLILLEHERMKSIRFRGVVRFEREHTLFDVVDERGSIQEFMFPVIDGFSYRKALLKKKLLELLSS